MATETPKSYEEMNAILNQIISSSKSGNQRMTPEEIDKYYAETPQSTGLVSGMAKGLGRGVGGAVKQIGQAIQGIPEDANAPQEYIGGALSSLGSKMQEWIPQPIAELGSRKEALFGMAESTVPSLVMGAPSMVGGIVGGSGGTLAIPGLGTVGGAAIGSGIGSAMTYPLMQRSAAREAYDILKKNAPNLSEQQIVDAANKYGDYEAQGETGSQLTEGIIMGALPGGRAVKSGADVLRKLYRPGFKQWAKNTGMSLPFEMGGEAYTGQGQARTLLESGAVTAQTDPVTGEVKPIEPWREGVKGAETAAYMSTILGGVGTVGQRLRGAISQKQVELQDPDFTKQLINYTRENLGDEVANNLAANLAKETGEFKLSEKHFQAPSEVTPLEATPPAPVVNDEVTPVNLINPTKTVEPTKRLQIGYNPEASSLPPIEAGWEANGRQPILNQQEGVDLQTGSEQFTPINKLPMQAPALTGEVLPPVTIGQRLVAPQNIEDATIVQPPAQLPNFQKQLPAPSDFILTENGTWVPRSEYNALIGQGIQQTQTPVLGGKDLRLSKAKVNNAPQVIGKDIFSVATGPKIATSAGPRIFVGFAGKSNLVKVPSLDGKPMPAVTISKAQKQSLIDNGYGVTNDSQVGQGIPSEVGVGKESLPIGFNEGASPEAISPSGNVQAYEGNGETSTQVVSKPTFKSEILKQAKNPEYLAKATEELRQLMVAHDFDVNDLEAEMGKKIKLDSPVQVGLALNFAKQSLQQSETASLASPEAPQATQIKNEGLGIGSQEKVSQNGNLSVLGRKQEASNTIEQMMDEMRDSANDLPSQEQFDKQLSKVENEIIEILKNDEIYVERKEHEWGPDEDYSEGFHVRDDRTEQGVLSDEDVKGLLSDLDKIYNLGRKVTDRYSSDMIDEVLDDLWVRIDTGFADINDVKAVYNNVKRILRGELPAIELYYHNQFKPTAKIEAPVERESAKKTYDERINKANTEEELSAIHKDLSLEKDKSVDRVRLSNRIASKRSLIKEEAVKLSKKEAELTEGAAYDKAVTKAYTDAVNIKNPDKPVSKDHITNAAIMLVRDGKAQQEFTQEMVNRFGRGIKKHSLALYQFAKKKGESNEKYSRERGTNPTSNETTDETRLHKTGESTSDLHLVRDDARGTTSENQGTRKPLSDYTESERTGVEFYQKLSDELRDGTIAARDILSSMSADDVLRFFEYRVSKDSGVEFTGTRLKRTEDPSGGRISSLAKLFKKNAVFLEDASGELDFQGFMFYVKGENTIFINKKNSNIALPLLGHELFHFIQLEHPDLYNDFLEVVKDNFSVKEWVESYGSTFDKNKDWNYSELTADMFGNLFERQSFWDKVGKKNPTLLEKIVNWIKGLINKINKNPMEFPEEFVTNMEKIEDAAVTAFNKYQERSGSHITDKTPGSFAKYKRGITKPAGKIYSSDIKAVIKHKDAVVVQSIKDLPQALQDQIKKEGADPDGLFDRESGKIYLIADNIESIEHAATTLLYHELTHKGIQNLGERGVQLLNQIYLKHKKEIDAMKSVKTDKLDRTNEFVARFGETKLNTTLWEKIKQFISDMYSKITGKEIKDADLRALLKEAKRTLDKGVIGKGLDYMTVWHGTPHTIRDRFSTAFIGTGEGVQAYGWGLYFADARDVAEWYKKKLSNMKINYKGSPLDTEGIFYGGKGNAQERAAAFVANQMAEFNLTFQKAKQKEIDRVVTLMQNPIYNGVVQKAERKQLNALLELKQNDIEINKGKLYKVKLAPAEDEYLLWDRPLSEQSEKVWEALQQSSLMSDIIKSFDDMIEFDDIYNEDGEIIPPFVLNGKDIYRDLETHFNNKFEPDKAASEYLHSLGIRGIKYLDGTSRSKGEGNYNYVIFNDADITGHEQIDYSEKRVKEMAANLDTFMKEYGITGKGKLELQRLLSENFKSTNIFKQAWDKLLRVPWFVEVLRPSTQVYAERVENRTYFYKDMLGAVKDGDIQLKDIATTIDKMQPSEKNDFFKLLVYGDKVGKEFTEKPDKFADMSDKAFTQYKEMRRYMTQMWKTNLDAHAQIFADIIVGGKESEYRNLIPVIQKIIQDKSLAISLKERNVLRKEALVLLKEKIANKEIKNIKSERNKFIKEYIDNGVSTKIMERLVKESKLTEQELKPFISRIVDSKRQYQGLSQSYSEKGLEGYIPRTRLDGGEWKIELFKTEEGRKNGRKVFSKFFNTKREANLYLAEMKVNPEKYIPQTLANLKDGEEILWKDKNGKDIQVKELEKRDYLHKYNYEESFKILEQDLNKLQQEGTITKEQKDKQLSELKKSMTNRLLVQQSRSNRIRRKKSLVEGFEENNPIESINTMLTRTANALARVKYVNDQLDILHNANPSDKRRISEYITESMRPLSPTQKMAQEYKNFTAIYFMGFRPLTAIMQLTQLATIVAADLGMFAKVAGIKTPAHILLANAMKTVVSGNMSKEEEGIIKKAEALGETFDNSSQTALFKGLDDDTVSEVVPSALRSLSNKGMWMFTKAEEMNRKVAILAAYRVFKAQGLDEDTAFKKAIEFNSTTNFMMSTGNIPSAYKNAPGMLAYSLMSYTMNMINWIINRSQGNITEKNISAWAQREAALKMMGYAAVLGGLTAVPGADDMNKLLRKFFGKDLKFETEQFIKKHAGENIANAIVYGMFAPLGINISSNMAVRLPFVSGLLDDKSVLESGFGASAAMANKGVNAVSKAMKGDVWGTIEAGAPEAVSNAMRQYRLYDKGQRTASGEPVYFEGKPVKPSGFEAFLQGTVGLKTQRRAEITETKSTERALQSYWNDKKKEYTKRAKEGDTKAMQQFNQMLLKDSTARKLVQPIKKTSLHKPEKKTTMFEQSL